METEQQKTIDWKKEVANLKEKTEFWEPKEGTTFFVFLENGEDVQGKDYQKKDCVKHRFKVSVNKEIKVWEIFKNYPNENPSKNGLYGQIARFASTKGGLIGQAVILNRQGKGKETKYALIDPTSLTTGGGQ